MIGRRGFGYTCALGAASAALAAAGVRLLPDDDQDPETPSNLDALTSGRIVVRPAAVVGEISPLLFGCAVEWTDNGNFLYDPERRQLRRDMLDALAHLNLPVWRFPGGIMADHYHWRDGIGSQSSRPMGANPMDGTPHRHTFGTDEFITLLNELSADALVTANVGSGTYEELEAWADYFKAAGRPVRYWELGNEIYLAEPRDTATVPGNDARIYHTPQAYAEKARSWAQALRKKHPEALIGAIAGTTNTSRENANWLDVLLASAAHAVDFVALHNAFAPLITSAYDYGSAARRRDAYRAMAGHVGQSLDDTRAVAARLRDATGRPPRIAITEHFPLFGVGGNDAQIRAILDQSRTMASALYTASLFHAWIREGVWLATYNLATSRWFGALLTDTTDGLVKTPTYHVFDLYRNELGGTQVEVDVHVPAFTSRRLGVVAARTGVALLDCVATAGEDGSRTLMTICRHFDRPVEATIEGLPDATVDVRTLGAAAPDVINGPSLTPTTTSASITPRTTAWNHTSGKTYSFPPNSVTLMRWPPAQTAPQAPAPR